MFDRVQKDLEQPVQPIIAESPRSKSSEAASKINSLEKLSPMCDSISSLSKLESLCTQSKRDSAFPLTDRQLNFLNGEEIAQMLS